MYFQFLELYPPALELSASTNNETFSHHTRNRQTYYFPYCKILTKKGPTKNEFLLVLVDGLPSHAQVIIMLLRKQLKNNQNQIETAYHLATVNACQYLQTLDLFSAGVCKLQTGVQYDSVPAYRNEVGPFKIVVSSVVVLVEAPASSFFLCSIDDDGGLGKEGRYFFKKNINSIFLLSMHQ